MKPHLDLRAMKRGLIVMGPVAVLVLLNVYVFRAHYLGKATFPWDFLGGYHAQSFGWFDRADPLAPPAWLASSSMGFPSFLALQAGGWYLPLELLHVAGVSYTFHVATVVQVLHVLFGALGAYLLSRRMGASTAIALLAGIAYHFSVAFYSNQEHVDIVRASAWMPWLLYSLHPAAFRESRWGALIGGVILSQLLVSGYPGNIVSTVYASAAWVVFLASQEWRSGRAKHYLAGVIVTVVAGTLMAMPKWLPLVLNGKTGLYLESLPSAPFGRVHLLTLLMPYDLEKLPGDVTMRSVWLPLAGIWGLAYADMRERRFWAGAGLVLLALVFGMVIQGHPALARWIPGMQVSRFPLSDWRPVLTLGFIIASSFGWERLLSSRMTIGSGVLRTMVASAVAMFVLLKAIRYGFDANAIKHPLENLWILTALCLFWVASSRASNEYKMAWLVSLLVLCASDGYLYNKRQSGVWLTGWDDATERHFLGATVTDFIHWQREGMVPNRRPARFVSDDDVAEALAHRNYSLNNRCWYERSYCVFAYDNLRMSAPHKAFLEALALPGGQDLLDFVARPQQLLILPMGTGVADERLPSFPKTVDPAIGSSDGVNVIFLSYGQDAVRYRISSDRDVTVVENELWWPGWKVQICSLNDVCQPETDAVHTAQMLRSWTLPRGHWIVRLRFVGPSPYPGYVCLGIGLLISLVAGISTRIRPRFGNLFGGGKTVADDPVIQREGMSRDSRAGDAPKHVGSRAETR